MEYIPRRIGDDGVKAAAVDDDFVEFVGPVKGFEGLDVGEFEFAFFGFAFLLFGGVPGGLFVGDAEGLELIEEEFVEDGAGFGFEEVDVPLEGGEVLKKGRGFLVEADALVLFAEEFVVFRGLPGGDVGLLFFPGGGDRGGLGSEAERFLVGEGDAGLLEALFWRRRAGRRRSWSRTGRNPHAGGR